MDRQQEVRGYKRYVSRAIHVHDVIVTVGVVSLEPYCTCAACSSGVYAPVLRAVVVEHLTRGLQQTQPPEVAFPAADPVQVTQGPEPGHSLESHEAGLGYMGYSLGSHGAGLGHMEDSLGSHGIL